VIMNRDAERLRGLDDRLRHVDIGARWRRVSGRMIVDLSVSLEILRVINTLNRESVGVEPLIGVCKSRRLIESPVRPGRSRKGPDLHAYA
jgi:hypothetical protein